MIARLAARLLVRELAAGEVRAVFAALALACAAVSAVGFVAERAQRGLERQANTLLAADLVLSSAQPLDPALEAAARRAGLAIAHTVTLLSMVRAGDQSVLADVKAVGSGYPLRGELRVRRAGREVRAGLPAPSEAWLEVGLFARLRIKPGDTVMVGDRRLVAARVLTHEPDRGAQLFTIAPRLLMRLDALPSTHLIAPGSRATYRLLVAGHRAALARFRAELKHLMPEGVRLEDVREGRPALSNALARGAHFLDLAALTAVLLAAAAIALGARRYAERHYDTVALARALGATRTQVRGVFLAQNLLLALAACVVGGALGVAAQAGLATLLAQAVALPLPAPSLRPLATAVAVTFLLDLGFALPPLWRLPEVPPLRVLRREASAARPFTREALAIGAVAASLVIALRTGATTLTLYVMGATLLTLLALALAAYGVIAATVWLRARGGGAWRFGLANLARRRVMTVSQVVAFGVALMALLGLSVVRNDLLRQWRASLPPEAPNRFLINVQPAQTEAIRTFLRERGLAAPAFYPSVRARLVALNGRALAPRNYESEQARRLLEHEFNLSWSSQVPPDNRLVAGRWWAPDARAPLLSVETGVAQALKLKLGDTLRFQTGDKEIVARVANLRAVRWDSFRVNFFVVMNRAALADFTPAYLTSFYLPPGRDAVLDALVNAFPNVTVIDVEALLAKVRGLVDQLSRALEAVFLFSVAAGALVIYAAVQATRGVRVREAALLRTLGAGRRQLLGALAAEFTVLGAVAGVIGAAGAQLLGYVLATRVFHLPYHLDYRVWVAGVVAGVGLVGLAGLASAFPVLRTPPWRTLQQGE